MLLQFGAAESCTVLLRPRIVLSRVHHEGTRISESISMIASAIILCLSAWYGIAAEADEYAKAEDGLYTVLLCVAHRDRS